MMLRDGTTTATILAQAIVSEGMKNIAAGANPIILQKGIKKATELVVEKIKSFQKPIETKEAISQVGAISSADPKIGQLIADAMEKIGTDGVITIEESNTMDTVLSVVEGMQFEAGFLSLIWHRIRKRWLPSLMILLSLLPIRRFRAFKTCFLYLNKLLKQASLLIIADDLEGDAQEQSF